MHLVVLTALLYCFSAASVDNPKLNDPTSPKKTLFNSTKSWDQKSPQKQNLSDLHHDVQIESIINNSIYNKSTKIDLIKKLAAESLEKAEKTAKEKYDILFKEKNVINENFVTLSEQYKTLNNQNNELQSQLSKTNKEKNDLSNNVEELTKESKVKESSIRDLTKKFEDGQTNANINHHFQENIIDSQKAKLAQANLTKNIAFGAIVVGAGVFIFNAILSKKTSISFSGDKNS